MLGEATPHPPGSLEIHSVVPDPFLLMGYLDSLVCRPFLGNCWAPGTLGETPAATMRSNLAQSTQAEC